MKKALYLVIGIILIIRGIDARGQVYRGMTYDELARPLQQMARAHNEMMSAINSLSSYVVDVLGHDIDSQLRKEMNDELKNIDNLGKQLANYGYSAAIVNNYNAIYRNIQKEIANYNNRVAKAREQAAREEAEQRERAARLAAEPKEWSGTGFALKDGYIVTNYHVVDRAKRILVYGVNGTKTSGFDAKVVATDQAVDLAILKISDSRFSGFGTIPYAIKSQDADVGESIWVLGYPLTQYLGNEIKLTNGLVSSKSGYQGDWSTYQISAPVQPGNSGGPLFDSKGNIVGIVNSGVPGAENVGYAIKASYLKNLAARYSLSSSLPISNSISSLALTEQVKRVNNFVFLLICSDKAVSTSASLPSSSSYPSGSSSRSSASATSSSTSSYNILFALSHGELTLKIGQRITLSANKNDSPIKWESMDTSVATVTSSGEVTAVGAGRTSVWATTSSGMARCIIIVEDPSNSRSSSYDHSSSKEYTLPYSQLSLYVGGSFTMTLPRTSWHITWTSDDTRIATVTSSGTITGVGVGKTTIWAKSQYGFAKCVVFVEQKP